jgi:hypothetical protein
MPILSRIHGVDGTEPIGAALTIGVKDHRGVPTQKDWLHIRNPYESPGGRREPHPAFRWWNDLPAECLSGGRTDTRSPAYQAHAHKRRVVRGIIAHTDWSQCLQQPYLAYRAKGKPAPPDSRPWCKGDGERAHRYIGEKGPDDWRSIACPGEECPHRQSTGRGTDCKPSTLFLFRLSFSSAVMDRYHPPTPVVRFASGGWRTYRAILGLCQSLDRAAASMGLSAYSPLGYAFTLSLQEGTSRKDGGRRYPFVTVSPDESAVDFLLRSQDARDRLSAAALTVDDTQEGARQTSGPGDLP